MYAHIDTYTEGWQPFLVRPMGVSRTDPGFRGWLEERTEIAGCLGKGWGRSRWLGPLDRTLRPHPQAFSVVWHLQLPHITYVRNHVRYIQAASL